MVIFYHFQNEGGEIFFYKFFWIEKNKRNFYRNKIIYWKYFLIKNKNYHFIHFCYHFIHFSLLPVIVFIYIKIMLTLISIIFIGVLNGNFLPFSKWGGEIFFINFLEWKKIKNVFMENAWYWENCIVTRFARPILTFLIINL